MTTNQLTAEQIAPGGSFKTPRAGGFGVAVSPQGGYGWDGGYGTVWFNDPARQVTVIAFTQCSDFLFNGSRDEFISLI